jgi:hypothetical protein
MELVLTHQSQNTRVKPLPKQKRELFVFKNEGLLTSSYKAEIQDNFFHSNPTSVFGIKQHIKSEQYQRTLSIETILKLSVFAIAIIMALS